MDLFNLREPVSSLTHAVWLLFSIPATILLLRRSRHDRSRRRSLLIYGGSLGLCAGLSAVYHGLRLPSKQIALLSHLDHIGIGIFIAGTYTPIAMTLLHGRWRTATLTLVWLAAALGAGIRLWLGTLSPWLSTTLYLAMGWGSILCYVELARRLSHRALAPIVVGGIFYSIGAYFHVARWPVLWTGLFEGHELFHLFVMAGSLAHYRFVLQVIASGRIPAPPPARALLSSAGADGSSRPRGRRREVLGPSRFGDPSHETSRPRLGWIPRVDRSAARRQP